MQKRNISLLQSWIGNICTARFFNGDVLPFPAYIISVLKTDAEGCIWFSIGRDENRTIDSNLTFPSELDFYRKGCTFSIKIKGQASLVNDKEILLDILGKNIPVKESILREILMIKVKIESYEYRELVEHKKKGPQLIIFSAIKNIWSPTQPQLQPSL